ncbi:CYTH domain-containing protein [Thioclava dalianensis]|uniref:CYTH domain-containing protein n=1 Tax=Thioclava dalianensis TaxID=1185766 RepID=UPI0009446170|nr:CYTH domain-containing protein [Thioclava dalianensis]
MTKGEIGGPHFEIGAVMAKGIERKFLLSAETWRGLAMQKVEIHDGLLAFRDRRKIRVRFCDDKATLSVKGPKKGVTRDEIEYESPASDGLALLEDHCDGKF